MRCYLIINEEKLELEDSFMAQFLLVDTPVYVEKRQYLVKEVKKVLTRAGNSLDSILEITLE